MRNQLSSEPEKLMWTFKVILKYPQPKLLVSNMEKLLDKELCIYGLLNIIKGQFYHRKNITDSLYSFVNKLLKLLTNTCFARCSDENPNLHTLPINLQTEVRFSSGYISGAVGAGRRTNDFQTPFSLERVGGPR